MRKLRFLAFAVISFVAALLGALLSPSTWLHKSLAVALCGVLSANPALCTNNAIAIAQSQEASATNPVKVETTQSNNLLTQRSGDFDDDTPKYPPRPNPNNPKPPSFPNDPGSNFPVRSPDFDSSGSSGSVNLEIEPGMLDLMDAKALSKDTFEITLKSRENCILKAVFKADINESFFESANYIPKNASACGSNSYSFIFQNKNSKIIVESSSKERMIFEKIDNNTGRFFYKQGNQDIQQEFPLSNETSISETRSNFLLSSSKLMPISKNKAMVSRWLDRYTQYENQIECGTLRALCDIVPFMQAAAAIQVASGIAASSGAVTFLLHYLGSVGCYMVFGGVPPIPLGSVVGRGLGLGSFGQNVLTGLSAANRIIRAHWTLGGIAANAGGNQLPGFDGPWKRLCKKRNEGTLAQKFAPNKKTGSSYGDPHIVTFDGYRYSFQTVGEFTLVKSTDRSFEVQVRQSPVPGAQLSLNSAVAIKSGNSRIAIYGQSLPDSDNSTPIRVDGRPYPAQGGTLPNGTIIAQQGQGSYMIQITSGEVVSVRKTSRNNLSYMDVNPSVPDIAGRYLGLLGNSNGNPKDDLQTRSGQVIETQSTYGQIAQTASSFIPGVGRIAGLVSKVENIVFDQLYKEFGNSWRISQADSLFDYKSGHTTDTFTDRGFPSSYRTLSMLSPAQVQTATAACQQANVNPEQLEGCIFDVGFTGDSGFAETASQALEIVNTINQLVPNAIPLPKLPVSIPGLPF